MTIAIFVALSLIIFGGLTVLVNSFQKKETPKPKASSTIVSTNDTVTTSCYTYALPKNYVSKTTKDSCSSSINTSENADDLTAVKVAPLSSEVTGDAVAVLKQSLEAQGSQVVSTTSIQVDGITAAEAFYTDPQGLSQVYVLLPVKDKVWTQNGKQLHSFSISSYTSSDEPSKAMQAVLKNFHYKAPSKDKQDV
jgi:hypothetical protein